MVCFGLSLSAYLHTKRIVPHSFVIDLALSLYTLVCQHGTGSGLGTRLAHLRSEGRTTCGLYRIFWNAHKYNHMSGAARVTVVPYIHTNTSRTAVPFMWGSLRLAPIIAWRATLSWSYNYYYVATYMDMHVISHPIICCAVNRRLMTQ